jgi:chromate transport protein ChrA
MIRLLHKKNTRKKSMSKKNIPQAFEYTHFTIMRFFTVISAIIVIVLFVYVGWFLYKKVYQSIGTVETLLVLQADPTLEPIAFPLYDDVLTTWQQRFNLSTSTHNPFTSHIILESE